MDGVSSQLLHSNVPPTDEQSDYVRQLVLQRQQEALDLEEQYRITYAALLDIDARRKQNQRDIEVLGAVFAPIRRIPVELLAEIFQFCIPTLAGYDPNYRISDPCSVPIVLTRVCSVWREVAVNTPHLWTGLVLRLPNRHGNVNLPMVETLVHRSNPLPITVTIHSDQIGTSLYDQSTGALTILPAVFGIPQLVERVETLDINLFIRDIHHSLRQLPIPIFPALQTLILHLGKGQHWRRTLATFLEFFGYSPVKNIISNMSSVAPNEW
ncbi:F-box domain-containing protein [Mycena venus]|uniref:F-box domain-containing protein n=1 Tax=Mycena venus TaxID=2733690 RepID=A0A8H7CHL1_9AGAR|nr:F-box domain-containing protein [Mycena venus]